MLKIRSLKKSLRSSNVQTLFVCSRMNACDSNFGSLQTSSVLPRTQRGRRGYKAGQSTKHQQGGPGRCCTPTLKQLPHSRCPWARPIDSESVVLAQPSRRNAACGWPSSELSGSPYYSTPPGHTGRRPKAWGRCYFLRVRGNCCKTCLLDWQPSYPSL